MKIKIKFALLLIAVFIMILFGIVMSSMIIFMLEDSPSTSDIILGLGIIISYCFFSSFLFFYLPPIVLSFPPQIKIKKSLSDIQREITEYFEAANKENKIFDLNKKGKNLSVKWSADLKYNQVFDVGRYSKKATYILRFDEKTYSAVLIQREMDISINLNPRNFNCSMYFYQGIVFDYEIRRNPSFGITNGRLQPRVEKMNYNTMEILEPISWILSNGGWTLRMGILQTNVLAWTLLVISISVFVSSFFYFIISFSI
jgi:ABC-type multidrug transport system fused ATPase/permease subunit